MLNAVVRRHRSCWFADFKAWLLARWVGAVSDETLQSVMRSRVRGVLLWQIFRTISQRAQPRPRLDAVVEFRISGRRGGASDSYQVMLSAGRGRSYRRGKRRPAVTLELEPVAFLRLVGGTASPQRLLLAGRLKLRGDLILALGLPTVLRLPKGRPQVASRRR
jgi:hypothetical protein